MLSHTGVCSTFTDIRNPKIIKKAYDYYVYI